MGHHRFGTAIKNTVTANLARRRLRPTFCFGRGELVVISWAPAATREMPQSAILFA